MGHISLTHAGGGGGREKNPPKERGWGWGVQEKGKVLACFEEGVQGRRKEFFKGGGGGGRFKC